jgi:hypothetical protein
MSRFEAHTTFRRPAGATGHWHGVWDNKEGCWAAVDNGWPYRIPLDISCHEVAKRTADRLNAQDAAGLLITPWDLDINLFDPTGLRRIPARNA